MVSAAKARDASLRGSQGLVLLCGTCLDARGLVEGELITDVWRSTMDELAEATLSADKVLVF